MTLERGDSAVAKIRGRKRRLTIYSRGGGNDLVGQMDLVERRRSRVEVDQGCEPSALSHRRVGVVEAQGSDNDLVGLRQRSCGAG
jgi:hypothetical protein